MAYSTPSQVRQILVPSSDGSVPSPLSHTAADMSDDELTDVVAEADAMIDGYIGGRYQTPVQAVSGSIPAPIPFWSRTIAAYLATCTFRGSQDFTDTDPIARRYADVLAMLKAVSSGSFNLTLPGTGDTGTSGAAGAGAPANPYDGDLWTPDDFSITQNLYPEVGHWHRGW